MDREMKVWKGVLERVAKEDSGRRMDREAKVWKCRHCGGAMGVVVRNGSGIRQLLLYRYALTPDPSPNSERGGKEVGMPLWDGEGRREDEPDVMAVVEGYVADVRCSICGRVRTWVPGPEAVRKMVEDWRRGL